MSDGGLKFLVDVSGRSVEEFLQEQEYDTKAVRSTICKGVESAFDSFVA